ncbi:two-component system, sensor histidine kinase FlrB [Syntrophus gentianae]|uniref:histidine kinase n=1 Tax=Syntrophus gentianae TaxID=43775 RepID=A0A1H7VDF6_9BACT|nr:ATP-binding protein [Syntrophus gentianae]SEM06945.1 two-component system, sensor histidine kinase FlrB [Syntrophus gentianae]
MNDITSLQKSFEGFNQATLHIQQAFASLEKKFDSLNRELEEKNEELLRTLSEKEEMKSYLQNILESLTNGVLVTNLEDEIQVLNHASEGFLGKPQGEVIGKHLRVLFRDLPSSEWMDIFLNKSCQKGRGARLTFKDRLLEITGSPIKSGERKTGTVFILRDITRIEKLEGMAKRSEKFTALGEMAANIAHEIRNPLGSIELYASLLMKELKGVREKDRISRIISSVKKMDNKISNLLLFTKNRNLILQRIPLHNFLNELLGFCEPMIDRDKIFVNVAYAEEEPWIEGDVEMLKQAFFNLILNALQSLDAKGGSIGFETSYPPGQDQETDEPFIEIKISDSGSGIPRAMLARIFDPFFTTREEGSGLGLAIVHNIIEMHRGYISVESVEGKGTVVQILLPLVK